MPTPSQPVREAHGFRFIDERPASSERLPVVLLHGMLGNVSNWAATAGTLSANGYRVLVPVLPVYDLPLTGTSIKGLVQHTHAFVKALGLERFALAGNSLGGQVALFYVHKYPERVAALVLSGASGIYERRMGTSTFRRKDRAFIRERAAVTFYDDALVTDELVDEMYELVNDRPRALRLIKMARSSKNATITSQLPEILTPTLLVWGRDDEVTPPDVAEQFLRRLPNARLHFIDRCGHAPMMERPDAFNRLLLTFLGEHTGVEKTPASTPEGS